MRGQTKLHRSTSACRCVFRNNKIGYIVISFEVCGSFWG